MKTNRYAACYRCGTGRCAMEVFNGLECLIIQVIIPGAFNQSGGYNLPFTVKADLCHGLALLM
ncbi:hypothetical protein AA0483_1460 [Acetobacter syzygii NRIC 0483]|nr:hypothetical protein AA0483_1460 [Acetobacter syzygii NRIC 0483]